MPHLNFSFFALFSVFLLSISLLALDAQAASPSDQERTENPREEQTEEEPEPSTPRRAFDPEHRREIYETSKLSRRTALLYTAALPGLGNFYAEQYFAGVISLAGAVFSAMFLGYGFTNAQSEVIRLGIGLAAVTYIGSGASAIYGVNAYNERLRRNLHLEAHAPTPSFALQWSFSF